MKRYFRSSILLLGAALILATPMVVAQQKAKEAPAAATTQTGADLYRDYCASCHGLDGHGRGPATEALRTPPNDLTMIAKQNNGKYDTRYIKHVIQGDKSVTAHGSSEMPSWGTKFRSMTTASDTDKRLNLLVEYIHSIQR